MILTMDLLDKFEGCEEGKQYAIDNNLIGVPFVDALAFCRTNKATNHYIWMKDIYKSTKYYKYGNIALTPINKYTIYNPLTGLNEQYNGIIELQESLESICKNLINTYKPTVCRVLETPEGDHIWDPVPYSDITILINLPE